MTQRSRDCLVSCAGAAIGAVAAYMFFTDAGRQLRQRIEPALEDFSRELNSFRGTMARASGIAGEGWKLLNEALGESGPPRYGQPHQSSPF